MLIIRRNECVNLDESSPFVSIVIPTYNRARLLRRAVQSILNQTYQNFEIIIVDDCSNDNTENVVKSFPDERIRYIRHEKNKGAVVARNGGIKAARGEYIAFQDSDDEWLPEKLEKQMKAFENGPPNLGVVYTSFWLIDGSTKTYSPPSYVKRTEGEIHDALLEVNFIGTPTVVVKKECFEKAGLFKSLPRLQEWDLWIRISEHYSFSHVNEPLVNAYLQPDSISRNTNAFIIARKYILEKYFEEISKKPKILRRHYFEIGTLHCLNGEIEAGRSYFFKAIRINPFDAKLFLSTLFSIFGLGAYNKVASVYLRAKAQELGE
jgi:glycosyltransferase involved in cell wall biosynthesis